MHSRFKLPGAALLVALLVGCSLSAAARSDESFDKAWSDLEARFRQRLVDEHVVGGALVFTSAATGNHSVYFGMQDAVSKHPVDDATIFHWASITKTLTAIAVLQLVERGRLKLEDPVTRYLPEFKAVHNPFGTADDVTVRHLLTHTSGLRSPTWPWGGDQPWQPHEPTQWSQLVAMMPYTQIEFRPGERYQYSNPGYTFLGRIVEVLSGEDIEAYLDKNVLRPLNMHSSFFDLTPPHLLEHRSNNYYVVDGSPVANGIDFDTGVTNGNGGLNASIADMTRYVQFLSGRDPRARYPLPRATLEQMWRSVVQVGSEPVLTESMGQGFFIVDFDDDGNPASPPRRFIGHTGTQMGFRAFIYFDPLSRAAALMAVNARTAENYRGLYNDTRRELFSRIFPLAAENR